MYMIHITGFVLLFIYSIVNLHIVTWGTRETNPSGTDTEKVHAFYVIMCIIVTRFY